MVLQHAKRIVAAGSGNAIEGAALSERRWRRGVTIAGGIRTNGKLGGDGRPPEVNFPLGDQPTMNVGSPPCHRPTSLCCTCPPCTSTCHRTASSNDRGEFPGG